MNLSMHVRLQFSSDVAHGQRRFAKALLCPACVLGVEARAGSGI